MTPPAFPAEPLQVLHTRRLRLEPLAAAHAPAMFAQLGDPELYRYIGHPPPPTLAPLVAVYTRLETRRSPDGLEAWLNWVLFRAGDDVPLGYVQATVRSPEVNWVAYVLARSQWGQGYASEAVQAMTDHLRAGWGAQRLLAVADARNQRSLQLLKRLGFRAATPDEAAAHPLDEQERLFVRRA